MLPWFVRYSWIITVFFLISESHGQGTGSNPDIPSDPLWPLFAELLSAETGRTVSDINILGLSDPTINVMWTTYQASMPKLDITSTSTSSSAQTTTPPPTPNLYQPSYSFSSQPSVGSGISTNTVSGTGTSAPSNYQDLLTMYNNIMSPSGGTSTTSTPGNNPMAMLSNMMMSGMTPSGSTSTSTSPPAAPSYTDLVNQYKTILSQSSAGSPATTTTSTSPLSPMINTYSQVTGGVQPSSPMNPMMNAYTQMMSGGVGGQTSPASNPMMNAYSQMLGGAQSQTGSTIPTADAGMASAMASQLMQLMGGGAGGGSPGATGTTGLDQLLKTYQQMMTLSGVGQPTQQATGTTVPVQPSGTSSSSSSVVSPYGGATGGSVVGSGPSSVDLSGSSVSQPPSPSSPSSSTSSSSVPATSAPTASSFDQQLFELFPQFKNAVVSPPSSSSSSSSATTVAPPASVSSSSSSSSSNSSDPQSATGISNTNSAQQVFDVLLFGGGGSTTPDQTTTQTGTGTPTSSGTSTSTGTDTGTSTATSNTPSGLSPLEQFIQQRNNMIAKSPGKMLSAHMQNVWKTRASRDMGCRFLPELLDMDILPTVPLDCTNKCPFPYVNSQRFGIYCVCCPPGVNDKLVSALSIIRRPSFINDNPLAVVS